MDNVSLDIFARSHDTLASHDGLLGVLQDTAHKYLPASMGVFEIDQQPKEARRDFTYLAQAMRQTKHEIETGEAWRKILALIDSFTASRPQESDVESSDLTKRPDIVSYLSGEKSTLEWAAKTPNSKDARNAIFFVTKVRTLCQGTLPDPTISKQTQAALEEQIKVIASKNISVPKTPPLQR